MDAKHTPGAIRAAEILVRDHWKRVHPRNRPTLIDGLATMIDRETAAPDLLEACNLALWIRDRLQERGSFGASLNEWEEIEAAVKALADWTAD